MSHDLPCLTADGERRHHRRPGFDRLFPFSI
jgi:hypothetical protein